MAPAKPRVEIVKAELVGADAGADVDWLASIPEKFTAHEGYEAADSALRFAKKAVRDVAFSYQGTIPPPPWPAHPELVKAMANMEKIRDFFEVVDERLKGTGKTASFEKASTTIKTGPTLTRYGKELYDQVGQLQGWHQHSASLDDFLKFVPKPGTVLFGMSMTTLLTAAAAAYVLSPRVRRWVGRFA